MTNWKELLQKESWTGPFNESLKGENVNQDKRNRLDDMLIALSEISAEEVSAERAQLSKEGINFSKLDDGIKSLLSPPKVQKHADDRLKIAIANAEKAVAE